MNQKTSTFKFKNLNKVIEFQVKGKLIANVKQQLVSDIEKFLLDPVAEDFTLEGIAARIYKLGVDYEAYVSALMFKMMPDNFTRKELSLLEDELYDHIEKELIGKELDLKITEHLQRQVKNANPDLSEKMVQKKAMGNWGWLLPHAMMQLLLEQITILITKAIQENASPGRKGGRGIRIKQM